MLSRKFSTQFKRDLKKYQHKQDVLEEFEEVLKILLSGKKLPSKYRDHNLFNNFKRYRECHIKPDVLLLYHVDDHKLYLYRIASHSEIFG